MSLGYNLGSLLISGGLLVALGFTINPAIGAALMALQACIILLNVYHFKQKPLTHLAQKSPTNELTSESFAAIQQKTNLLENNLSINTPESHLEEQPACFSSPLKPPSFLSKEKENGIMAQMTP